MPPPSPLFRHPLHLLSSIHSCQQTRLIHITQLEKRLLHITTATNPLPEGEAGTSQCFGSALAGTTCWSFPSLFDHPLPCPDCPIHDTLTQAQTSRYFARYKRSGSTYFSKPSAFIAYSRSSPLIVFLFSNLHLSLALRASFTTNEDYSLVMKAMNSETHS